MNGSLVVLAPDLVVLIPGVVLSAQMARELGTRWHEAAPDVRLLVMAEPLQLGDVRGVMDIAEILPALRKLADVLLGEEVTS